MKTKLLVFVVLVVGALQGQGQAEIKSLKLDNLTIRSIYKILKHDIEDSHSYWTYYSENPDYLKADNLEISNHRSFIPPEGKCYQTKWFYVDKRNDYININDGAYLCKEPPPGGRTTLNKLIVKKLNGKFYIEILDSSGKLNDKFEIKGIEYKVIYAKENAYRLKLSRLQNEN